MSAGPNPEVNANDNVASVASGATGDTSAHDRLIADSMGPRYQVANLNAGFSDTLFQENRGKAPGQIMQDANRNFPWLAPSDQRIAQQTGPQGLKAQIFNQIAPGFITGPSGGRPDATNNLTGADRAWRVQYGQVVPQAIPGFNGDQRVAPALDQRVLPQGSMSGFPDLSSIQGDQRIVPPSNAGAIVQRPEFRPQAQDQTQIRDWQLFGSSPSAIGAQFPEAQVRADGQRLYVQVGNAMVMVQKGAGADVQVGPQQQRLQGQPTYDIRLGNSEGLRIDVVNGTVSRFAMGPNGHTMFESIDSNGKRIKFEGGEPTQVVHQDGRRDTLAQGRLIRTDYPDRSFEEFDQAGKPVRALRNGVQYEYQNGLPTRVLSQDGRFFQARYDQNGKIAEYHIGRILNTGAGQQIQRIESGLREQGGVRVTKFDPATGQGRAMSELVGDVALSPTGSMQYLDAQGYRQEANGVRTRRDNRVISALVEGADGSVNTQQIQPLKSIVYPNGRSTEYMYLSEAGARVNGFVPGQSSPDAVFSYARRNAQGQVEEIGVRMPEVPGQPPQWLEFRANRVQGKTSFTNEEVQKIGQIAGLMVPGDPQQTASNLAALRANPTMREFLPSNPAEVTVGVQIDQATGKQVHVYANRDYRVLDENGGEHNFTRNGVISQAADGRRFHYDYATGNTTYLNGNHMQVVPWDSSRNVPGDKQVVLDVSNAQQPNMVRFGSRYNAQQIEFTYDQTGNISSFKIRQPQVQGDQVTGWQSQTFVRQQGNMWKVQETGEERELNVQRNQNGNVSVSGFKEVNGQRVAVNRTFQADGTEVVGTGQGDEFRPLYQFKAPPPPIAHGPVRFPSNVPPPDFMMERARAAQEAQNPRNQQRGDMYRRGPQDNGRRPYQDQSQSGGEEDQPAPRARRQDTPERQPTQEERRPAEQRPPQQRPPEAQQAEEQGPQNRRNRRRTAQTQNDSRNRRQRRGPAAEPQDMPQAQNTEPVSETTR